MPRAGAQKTLCLILIGRERHLVIANLKAPLRQLPINTCKITAVKPHFPTTINGEIGLEPGNSKGVEKPRPKEKPSPVTYPNRTGIHVPLDR